MSNYPERIHKIWHVTRQRALAHTADIYIDPYVSQPIETVANEASTYIYIYIYMCQSMLTRHAPTVVNALRTVGHCISEVKNKLCKYCSVSCIDRSFCFLRPQCIVTSRRV